MQESELPADVNPEQVVEIHADNKLLLKRLNALYQESENNSVLFNADVLKGIELAILATKKCYDPGYNIRLLKSFQQSTREFIAHDDNEPKIADYLRQSLDLVEQNHALFNADGLITAFFLAAINVCLAIEQVSESADRNYKKGSNVRKHLAYMLERDFPDMESQWLQQQYLVQFMAFLIAHAYEYFPPETQLATAAKLLADKADELHRSSMTEEIEPFYETLYNAYVCYKAAWLLNHGLMSFFEAATKRAAASSKHAISEQLFDAAKQYDRERIVVEEKYTRIGDSLHNAVLNVNNEKLQEHIYLVKKAARVSEEEVNNLIDEYIDNKWLYPEQYRELFLSYCK